MRRNHPISSILFLLAVMTVTVGCTSDPLQSTKQLNLTNTPTLQNTTKSTSVSNKLGGYPSSPMAVASEVTP